MRILSVPSRHPYVEAITPAGVELIDPDRVQGWDPDPALDPAQVDRWLSRTDAVHLHFGYDTWDAATARAWCERLATGHVALVVTVHDLRNPHHPSRETHDEVLAVLASHAAAVFTLTEGAAAEFDARFGRRPEVIEHPTLVDPHRSADVDTVPKTVGVALKSLRGNVIEPVEVVRAVAAGAATAGGRVQVDVHPEALGDPRLAGLTTLAEDPVVELVVHPRFSDLELERYLRSIHATVLPYRFGTHSGWLELARDLGTRVVAPTCGHYADQWSDAITYRSDEQVGLDAQSLTDAVTQALTEPPPPPADRDERLRQAERVRTEHAAVYARVVAGR